MIHLRRFTCYSPFTSYDHFMRSLAYWIWTKQSNRYIKTFSTLSGVRKAFFYFTAVRYSLQKCSKRILWLKRQFTVHVSPVFCAVEFMEARKTCYRELGPQSGQFLTVDSFATKIASSRLPRRWSSEARSVTLLGPINQMQLKGARPTAKKSGDGV